MFRLLADFKKANDLILVDVVGERQICGYVYCNYMSAEGALVCVGIDDDEVMRDLQMEVFEMMGASASRSVGETREEQLAFVDLALGLLNIETLEPTTEGSQADVALLDQRIDLDNETHLKGDDLAVEPRKRGFTGVVAIISGDDESGLEALRATAKADIVASKQDMFTTLPSQLTAARDEKRSSNG